MYKVKEIFGPTIQGEGSASGTSVLFLRLTGCNRWSGRAEDKAKSVCSFCDTDFVGGDVMSAKQIAGKLASLSLTVKTVVISGGEPLLQVDENLLVELVNAGLVLHLETNGSKALKDLGQYFEHVSMSPKQPMAQTKLERCDDVKLLFPWIGPEIDYDNFKYFNSTQMYLQPVWESDKNKILEYIYSHPDLKLSAQLHKYMELL